MRAAILAVALVVASGVGAQQQEPVEVPAPRLQVDDTWEYEIVDLWKGSPLSRQLARVIDVQGDTAVILFESQRVDEERPRKRGVSVDTRTLTEFNPVQPAYFFLGFPLQPGKTWQFDFINQAQGRATNKVERWAKVVGWETVSVPAGTFRALRVEMKDRRLWQAGDGVFPDHWYTTVWYVPEVKRFVRLEREHRAADSKRWSYQATILKSYSLK
ncbi:hypothetical protein H8N03_00680 [Ramlibacter sp. USB13]|uniref:Uncharacterized protein n=1 Tax=Ramlibacter cellulosilyticus TaxID=2764187 RepID=A0A923S995_9BURK|nr:hypothetical protein [Ramlibacter cellulosilyticus]MBC5781435.1 hypothetical protein [Ramlibacter cellulosilyticus]